MNMQFRIALTALILLLAGNLYAQVIPEGEQQLGQSEVQQAPEAPTPEPEPEAEPTPEVEPKPPAPEAEPGASAPADEPEQPDSDRKVFLLSLREAVAMALENGAEFEALRFRPWIAALDLAAAEGLYEPVFSVDVTRTESESATSSALAGANVLETENINVVTGIQGQITTGATYSLDVSGSRQDTNSTFSTLNPQWDTGASLSLTQPLLRDRGDAGSYSSILVAESSIKEQGHRFEDSLSQQVASVEDAYWRVLAAAEDLEVSQLSLKVAEQLEADNEARFRVQAIAEVELIQSRAAVATRREEVIRNQTALEDSRDTLYRLVNPLRWIEMNDEIAVQELDEVEGIDEIPAEVASIQEALLNRPDFKALGQAIETQRIQLASAANDSLPKVDVFGSYGFDGLGDSLSDSFDTLDDGDFTQWSMGLSVEIPLGNSSAESRETQARLSLMQLVFEMRATEYRIRGEVRSALRAIRSSQERVEAARQTVELRRKEYDVEKARQEQNMSTTWRVLDVEEDWIEAQRNLIRARIDNRLAWLEYERATGRLLDRYDIVLQNQFRPRSIPGSNN